MYGRAQCHLCEEMARELRALGVAFEEVDVDSDRGLRERYGAKVPVLAGADGAEICHYRLDRAALERFLQ